MLEVYLQFKRNSTLIHRALDKEYILVKVLLYQSSPIDSIFKKFFTLKLGCATMQLII